MTSTTLLVELFCEELPPKALKRLGDAFADGLQRGLAKRELLAPDHSVKAFATPRRLAASITGVKRASEPRAVEVKLMPAAVGLDASGKPTPALAKKLEAAGLAGIDPARLKRRMDGKSEMLFADSKTAAMPLAQALQAALEESIAGLPIPKVMSYQLADGETTVQFVRPAHGLVALHGADVVPVGVLGLQSGRLTHGHRFQGARDVSLDRSESYEAKLFEQGGVIAAFDERRKDIARQLADKARGIAKDFAPSEALLDEVNALVEMPTVYVGAFDTEFLAVPQECLILTMQQNQKYFPLVGADGKLLPKFLIVSNMRLTDPSNIVQGNERVVRPRLADARFFFETDKKVRLADRVPQLGSIVYHSKLGSQLERVERLRRLASRIQSMLPRGEKGRPYADRAALLAKADLVTLMVGEFPELQGIMGKYYAEADGEEPSVVRAIEQHYWPRFSGDQLPVGDVSIALALADKLETLVGIWGVGQQPTGDKDPFGLRRAALGVMRILSEKAEAAALDLGKLLAEAVSGFPGAKLAPDTAGAVYAFMLERLRSMLRDKDYDAQEIEAVLADNPTQVKQVWDRIEAVRAFRAMPEAEALAAANKRIQNILRKSESWNGADFALLHLPEEKSLHGSLKAVTALVDEKYAARDFAGALRALAAMRSDVDAFFDKVLVNAEDPRLRAARLGLLAELAGVMNKVADISKLFQLTVKLAILDRDGVINFDSERYIKSPAEWRPIPGSIEAIARLNQHGYRVAVATNQSGIGRGLFDMATFNAINDKMMEMVFRQGGRIDALFFCPHTAAEECACRKPRTGMLEEIATRFHTELKGVPSIGDSLKDLQAAESVGAQPILVLTGKGVKTRIDGGMPKKTLVFDDLAAASRHLVDNE